jgi:phosphoribosylformylglycinamidine synthase
LLDIDESDVTKAKARVTDMCEELLANTVIENYEIEIL